VIDLKTHNEALLMKHLHNSSAEKIYPGLDLFGNPIIKMGPYQETIGKDLFWWRDITKLVVKYKELAKVNLQDGRTCHLWSDTWHNSTPENNFSELHSFAKNKKITIREVKRLADLQDHFHLPLSEEATWIATKPLKPRTPGLSFGVQRYFLHPKSINSSEDSATPMQHTTGYGRVPAKTNIVFSSGWC
jgi:hypothetical protein